MTPLVVIVTLVAGALGALARYGITRAIARRFGDDKVTRGVLISNIVASFVAGGFIAGTTMDGVVGGIALVVVSGFAAGLSTFSTWAVETMQLLMGGKAGAALRSVLANLIWGFLAAFTGYVVVTWIFGVAVIAFGGSIY